MRLERSWTQILLLIFSFISIQAHADIQFQQPQFVADTDRTWLQSNYVTGFNASNFNANNDSWGQKLSWMYNSTDPTSPNYKSVIISKLDSSAVGSAFYGISDEGLLAIFSTIMAYELRQPINPIPGSSNLTMDTMLDFIHYPNNQYGIICGQYVPLAIQIYYRLHLQVYGNVASNIELTPFGVQEEAPTQNHVMLSATGAGVPLFLDPTTSTVAAASTYNLLNQTHVPASSIVRFEQRLTDYNINLAGGTQTDYQQTGPAGDLGTLVQSMLLNGTFDYRALSWHFGTKQSCSAYCASYGSYGFQYAPNFDYINTIIPAGIGGVAQFWYIKDGANSLWRIDSSGTLAMANSGGTQSIVPISNSYAQGFYMLNNGTLWIYTSAGWQSPNYQNLNNGSISQIAPESGYQALRFIVNGAMWVINNPSGAWTQGNSGGTAALVGTGDLLYLQTTSGQLWQIASTGWTLYSSNSNQILGTRPARILQTCSSGSCSISIMMNGQISYRDGFGATYGNVFVRNEQASWSQVTSTNNIYQLVVGTRGASINLLDGSGNLSRFDVPVPGTCLGINQNSTCGYAHSTGTLYQISEPTTQTIRYYPNSGTLYLQGLDNFNNQTFNIQSSTW